MNRLCQFLVGNEPHGAVGKGYFDLFWKYQKELDEKPYLGQTEAEQPSRVPSGACLQQTAGNMSIRHIRSILYAAALVVPDKLTRDTLESAF